MLADDNADEARPRIFRARPRCSALSAVHRVGVAFSEGPELLPFYENLAKCRGAKRVVLGTFQRLRNGKSCGIPGSGMILAIESYQRC